MAEYGEEHAELAKLNAQVFEDPDSYENWSALVKAAESLEGGLNRNSSPQSITAARDVYDRFLAKFPLFFGYWKKYADLEFAIAGTEAAELVYERGVASITNSVDLWTQYCSFKVETSHDPDVIRELFERAASCVGLDFLSHPFWDKYLEFEERLELFDRIFQVLSRIIHIPMHQYARYFERFRQLAQTRPIPELCQPELLAQFRSELEADPAYGQKTESDVERDLRARIDQHHLEIFSQCQNETTRRWTYEQDIKIPYFHVVDLDESQLVNWRKYLDFEGNEGEYNRIVFLYERCLVAAAYYDEFWLRYARWMLTQEDKMQEVRNIYQRASCLFAPIARPDVRLHYAAFEEMMGNVDIAHAIYEAVLMAVPGQVDTIIAWANSVRRNTGLDAAIGVFKSQVESDSCDATTKAALTCELARLIWKVKGSPEEARQIFEQNTLNYLDSRIFWSRYLAFEFDQPMDMGGLSNQQARVKQVHDNMRQKSQLPIDATKELSDMYMQYILERGTKDAAKEYLTLDSTINGPQSIPVQSSALPTGETKAVES